MKNRRELMERVHASGEAMEIPPVLLIVDDHADTLDMYDTLLSAQGYWVARADNGLEALEYAQELKPDVILTDLGLPGDMNGVDLIREIRADKWLQGTPILAVTGREPPDVLSLAGVELSALLLKPVAPETLLTRVDEALSHSAALRERSTAALAKVQPLLARSTELLARPKPLKNAHRHRSCPQCGTPLTWVESSRLNGRLYDYYRWCDKGCGLYCYDRLNENFELLAGGRGGPS